MKNKMVFLPSSTRRSLQNATIRRTLTIVGIILIAVELILLQMVLDSDPLVMEDNNLPPGLSSSSSNTQRPLQHPEKTPKKLWTPDGTFNGHDVYFHDLDDINTNSTYYGSTKPYSMVHCVGENYQNGYSWKHRSCHIRFMCFDVDTKEFSIYPRPEDIQMQQMQQNNYNAFFDYSQTHITNSTHVSLGGLNPKWGDDGMARLKWFPKIHPLPPRQFYTLSESDVMIPFHSLAGWNPGHLVWDDFLPIYTLLSMFHQLKEETSLLLLRMILTDDPHGQGLWASCEDLANNPKHSKTCTKMFQKFGPLMKKSTSNNNNTTQKRKKTKYITSQLDAMLLATPPHTLKSSLVCAKNGVAGLGPLTDHGIHKLHGWHEEDYKLTHNAGRAGNFWDFRNFCLHNLGVDVERKEEIATASNATTLRPHYKIVFSEQSSDAEERNLDFSQQADALRQSLLLAGTNTDFDVSIERVVLKELTLQQQVELATQTTIFVTGAGGGAVTATFLKRGATVIIYFGNGQRENVATGLPARLDWDLFNNLAYINVHWFPSETMNNTTVDVNLFVEVVRNDLKRRRQ